MSRGDAEGGGRRRRGLVARARDLAERQARLEAWFERRWPRLYDARHAASDLGRLLGPLVGAFLFALIVLPIVALIAGLLALIGAIGIDLPDVDVPLPDVRAPEWMRAIGNALADASAALKWPLIVALVASGLWRSRRAMRRRGEAEAVGRLELRRRLLVVLAAVEVRAREADTETIGDATLPAPRARAASGPD